MSGSGRTGRKMERCHATNGRAGGEARQRKLPQGSDDQDSNPGDDVAMGSVNSSAAHRRTHGAVTGNGR